jgi:monoamine oxidase
MQNQAAGNWEAADVIVIGAGMAGLGAARILAERGLAVTLLEAQQRVGGRILTVHSPRQDLLTEDLPIELGAEFVHGRPPELLELIDEAGLTLFERSGEMFCYEKGSLGDCNYGAAFEVLDELPPAPDMTFTEFLAQAHLPDDVAARAKNYVEGFNAADASRIGTLALRSQQEAEEAIDGNSVSFRVREGYDRVPRFVLERFLAAGGTLHLGTPVTAVDWSPGEVRVTTSNPAHPELRATRAVIALPLGVLQAGDIAIRPEPPTATALKKMAMGTAVRLSLLFKEKFWSHIAPDLSFLITQESPLPVWWACHPNASPILTGWAGGPLAAGLPTADSLQQQAIAELEMVFRRSDLNSLLISGHHHDWQSDPYSRGAYSYAPKGASTASEELSQPVDNTLFFAGEHTDTTGNWGTVHAALRSGQRAAKQILNVNR